MMEKEFNLKKAREGLKYILIDTTNIGFSLDEETAKAILHLVKTSDKEFIKRLKEARLNCYECGESMPDEVIDKIAGENLI